MVNSVIWAFENIRPASLFPILRCCLTNPPRLDFTALSNGPTPMTSSVPLDEPTLASVLSIHPHHLDSTARPNRPTPVTLWVPLDEPTLASYFGVNARKKTIGLATTSLILPLLERAPSLLSKTSKIFRIGQSPPE